MTNQKEWACSEGCDLSKGVICPHLEKLMPSFFVHASSKSQKDQISLETNATIDFFKFHFWSFDSSKFVELMRNYGFTDEWDLELLEAKYCRNLSAADVASEQNYVSKDKVKRRLRQLRELLRERGFEQERE